MESRNAPNAVTRPWWRATRPSSESTRPEATNTSELSTQRRSRASQDAAQIPRKPMIVIAFGVMPLRSTIRQTAGTRPGLAPASSSCGDVPMAALLGRARGAGGSGSPGRALG